MIINNMKYFMYKNIFRKLLITILLFGVTSGLQSQQLIWVKTFSTGKPAGAQCVSTDRDGNIVVVGSTYVGGNDDGDWIIIKYNDDGDTIWTRQVNVSNQDFAYAVKTDKLGNIIVTGETIQDSSEDFCTIKYDPDGNIKWIRTFHHSSEVKEEARGVAVDSKGNIIVAGTSSYSAIGFPDYVVIKYDSSGNLLWVRSYDGGWSDKVQDVIVDNEDNIIVTGYSDSNINWDWCTVKYSPNGDSLWAQRYDVSLSDFAYRLTTDKNCNVIVAGGYPATVLKYDADGKLLWEKIFPGLVPEIAEFHAVAVDSNNDIFLGTSYHLPESEFYDFFLMKCNSLGDTLWTVKYDGGYHEVLASITVDKFSDIITTGVYSSDPITPITSDILTIKYSSTTDVKNYFVNNIPKVFSLSQNFPNPFNSTTRIEFNISRREYISLKVYNILGQEIISLFEGIREPGTYNVDFDVSGLSSGVYLYRLTAGKFIDVKKMVLMK